VQRVALPLADLALELRAGQPVPGRDAYRLLRALGSGPGQDVWLAEHAKLGHRRVFKFAQDGARLAALKREFTLYRVLQQELGSRPDIGRVLDTNFVAPPFFIECDYGGENLLDWSHRLAGLAPLARAARLALFLQIARAVAAAHGVGVLHKDIKPSNVLVRQLPDGSLQACLTDFGSGRLLDPTRLERLKLTALGLTQAGLAGGDSGSGTPLYLAPELLAGHRPTVPADV